jgi:hypothetical protein
MYVTAMKSTPRGARETEVTENEEQKKQIPRLRSE